MALGLQSRNQRASARVDVLLRVKGELVPVSFPIRIFNINLTGLAVLSQVKFRSGQRLNFRLTGPKGLCVLVTAAAVHSTPRRDVPGFYLTGFTFRPERPGHEVPEADVRALIAAVAPAGWKI